MKKYQCERTQTSLMGLSECANQAVVNHIAKFARKGEKGSRAFSDHKYQEAM